jgi:4-amino-4-deoxy-L-arabinose transferase-like glycosyltransferase
MAREFGGRRGSQLIAAAAALPACLAIGALMQYVSFDYLCWVLSAYFIIRLLNSQNPRWWMAVGTAIGLGLLAKYGMVFWIVGVVAGFLPTNSRRLLWSKWFVLGSAIAMVIFLPNFLWQVHNHFISLDFLRHIHARDVRIGRTKDFLRDQIKMTLFAAPLWVMGLIFCLRSEAGRRYRAIGLMYLIPLLIFLIAKGRGYYLLGAYPMLYAAGAAWGERWLATLRHPWANTVRVLAGAALVFDAAFMGAITLPIAPIQSRWWKLANSMNGDLSEEIGWPELVQTVAQIRDTLPAEERAHLGILGTNYGEAGAINLYGPKYGLPPAISGVNSFWQRGYGNPPPQTLIVLGLSRSFMARTFDSCQLSAHTWNPYNVANEETVDHPDIYVCRGLKSSWPEFWKDFRYFG